MNYLKATSRIQYSNEVFSYANLSSYLRIACIILIINEVLQLTEVQSLVVNASHKVASACKTTDSFTIQAEGTDQSHSAAKHVAAF